MFINVSGVASEESSVLLPEGEQHMRVLKAEAKQSQKGKDMLQVILQPVDPEFALCDNIFHYMLFPETVDDLLSEEEKSKAERINRFRKLDFKNLLEGTGTPYDDSGFDVDDLMGREVTAIIRHENGDRGIQARVSRFVADA